MRKGVESRSRESRKFTIPSTEPPKKFMGDGWFLAAVLKLVTFPASLTFFSEPFLEKLSSLNVLRNYGDR